MYRIGPLDYENPFVFDMALLAPVLHMMENGITVDIDKKNELSAEYTAKKNHRQDKLNSVLGYALNVGSPKQVAECLYGDLGLPERRYSGRVTTSEPALRSLLALCESKIQKSSASSRLKWLRGYVALMEILKIRAIRKRISSYLNVKIDSDYRMRCTMSIGGTETGRFSHSKTLWGTGCNLATIPRELRCMFIAALGKELAEFDLNRGESWVYSHLAADPEMMTIHQEGRDFHAETACAISTAFGERIRIAEWEDFAKANPEKAYKLRLVGKKVNHATAYKMGPIKGAETVNKEADDTGVTCTSTQFKEAQRLWKRKYIRLPAWWSQTEDELGSSRTLKTPFGRIRTFYGQWGEELFKEAIAYRPQSTSVDFLNLGMLNVFHNLVVPDRRWGLKLHHQNHDSILVSYDEEFRDEVLEAIVDHMTHTVVVNGHKISIPVEPQFGHSWGELKEWKKRS